MNKSCRPLLSLLIPHRVLSINRPSHMFRHSNRTRAVLGDWLFLYLLIEIQKDLGSILRRRDSSRFAFWMSFSTTGESYLPFEHDSRQFGVSYYIESNLHKDPWPRILFIDCSSLVASSPYRSITSRLLTRCRELIPLFLIAFSLWMKKLFGLSNKLWSLTFNLNMF